MSTEARPARVKSFRVGVLKTRAAWPHGYVQMNLQPREFINAYDTNHAHVVAVTTRGPCSCIMA
jgi:hypothetical protein